MTHKELLWSDFRTRFGDREIAGFLRPELLKQIFEK